MKKFLFALLAFATIGFVSCSDDDDIDNSDNSDRLVGTAYIIEELPQELIDTIGFSNDLIGLSNDVDYAIALSFVDSKQVKVELSVSQNGTTLAAWAEKVDYQYKDGVGKFKISRNDVNNPGQKLSVTIDMQDSGDVVAFTAFYGTILFNAHKTTFTANRTVTDNLANTNWVADSNKLSQYADDTIMMMFSTTSNPIGMAFTADKSGTMQVKINGFGSATVKAEYTVDQLTKLNKYFGSFELKGTEAASRALANAIGSIGYVLNGSNNDEMMVYILLEDITHFGGISHDNGIEIYIPMIKTTNNPIEEGPTENPNDDTDYEMANKYFSFNQIIPTTDAYFSGRLGFVDETNGTFYARVPAIKLGSYDLSEIGDINNVSFTYTIEGNVITMTLDPTIWAELVAEKPILNNLFPGGVINGILSDGGNTITFKILNNTISITSNAVDGLE